MAGWVMNVLSWAGYSGLVFLMFAENMFPPIPSELIVPFAGYMVSVGKFTLVGVIAAGTAGSVLGALSLYYLGHKLGHDRTREFARQHGRWLTLSERDIERAKRWFDRHGGAAIFMCRMVPGIRSLISIPAGIGSVPMGRFLAFTAAGSAIWTALLAMLGYELGRNFHKIEEYLDPVTWGILALIVGIYGVRVVRGARSHGQTPAR